MQPLNQQDKPSTWMRLSNDLKRRKDLTSNAKLVYTHMLDKYVFFSRQDKEYYENMQDIGEELGMARRTVADCIKNLETAELLLVSKKKVHNSDRSIVSNSYIVKDIYNLYVPAKVLQMKPASKVYNEEEPF